MCSMTWLTIGRRRLRVLAGVAVCCVAVSGCADGVGRSGDAAASGGSDSSRGVASRAGVEMSGGYVVDEGGRLVQPERSWPDLVVDPVMKEESVEGVEAFARYFVAAVERARNTGETAELERISSKQCSFCTNLISMIGEEYSDGRWLDGLSYRILEVDGPVVFPNDAKRFAVVVHLRSSGNGYFNGESVVPISKKDESLELHVCRETQEWRTCEAIGSSDGRS